MTDDRLGRCWECGYVLRGLTTHRCPECGTPFDPAEPATMNMGEEIRGPQRWMMRPPGWPMYGAVAFAVLLSLWASAIPMPGGQIGYVLLLIKDAFEYSGQPWREVLARFDVPEMRFLYAFLAWGVIAIAWTVRRIARGRTVERLSHHKPAPFAYWRRWLIPHFVLAATVLFCMTPGPLHLGFWASKKDLDRIRLQQLASRKPVKPGVHWLGVYPTGEPFQPWTWRDPGMHNSVSESQLWAGSTYPNFVHVSQWGGFAYAPDRPPVIDASRLRYLGGGWYSFEWNVGVWR
jgi:hypothetical protein